MLFPALNAVHDKNQTQILLSKTTSKLIMEEEISQHDEKKTLERSL
jgi:hypothetical protein